MVPLSETSNTRLAQANKMHTGGFNTNSEQCDAVMKSRESTSQGAHMQSCYKNFILVLSKKRKYEDGKRKMVLNFRILHAYYLRN